MAKIESGEIKFTTVIKFDDYIVRDHRVHHVRIMPGVTFIDMIYRVLKSKKFSPDQLELRNILFKEAIRTTDEYDQKIRIRIRPKNDFWEVICDSQKVKGKQVIEDKWVDNCVCELHKTGSHTVRQIDPDHIKKQAREKVDMDDIYSFARKVEIHHYEFMKALGDVYVSDDYLLAEIHLSDLANSFVGAFQLHPTYLDASTIIAFSILAYTYTDDKPYIPFYIKSFYALEQTGQRVYVYAKRQKSEGSPDLVFNNIEIYNEQGRLLACFDKASCKKIRTKSSLVRNAEARTTPEEKADISGRQADQVAENRTSTADHSREVEMQLSELIARVAGKTMGDIEPDSGFYEMGLESTDLLQVVQELEQLLGEKLYPTLLFEYPNLSELSKYLFDNYKERFGNTPEDQHRPTDTTESTPDAIENITIELIHILSGILNKTASDIAVDSGFYEQGLESTQLLDIVRILEKKLDIRLYPTLLFEFPTIQELACYLNENHSDKFSTQSEKNDVLYYQPVWMDHKAENSAVTFSEDMLIFALNAGQEEAGQIKQHFSQKTSGHITVVGNSHDYSCGETGYGIDISREKDYQKLVNDILQAGLGFQNVLFVSSRQTGSSTERTDSGFYPLLYFVKALSLARYTQKSKIIFGYSNHSGTLSIPEYQGLEGFFKSLMQETPKLRFKLIEMHAESDTGFLQYTSDILGEFHSFVPNEVAYKLENSRRAVKRYQPVKPEKSGPAFTVRKNGTYLITGGAGGVARHFAELLGRREAGHIILSGRSVLSPEVENRLDDMRSKINANIEYIPCDVSNEEDVSRLITTVKKEHGALNGILHTAGVLEDAFAINKTKETTGRVLAPKISGTIYLDKATQSEPLDFFVLFSSTTAVLGNVGQSDYAYSNGFLDSYASVRNQQVAAGKRQGKTVSINWPYWKEGGMTVDETAVNQWFEATGMRPLSTVNGLLALQDTLTSSSDNLIVIEGDKEKIKSYFKPFSMDKKEAVKTTDHHTVKTEALKEGDKNNDKIAIIGINGKFPQAENLSEFWENLKNGKDCIEEIPADRWDLLRYYDAADLQHSDSISKWGGFLKDVDKFDPLFFKISPKQAEWMDPQERLFLECAWHTIQNAGYSKSDLSKYNVGVFSGVMWGEYQFYGERNGNGTVITPNSISASVSNRVSYCLDLKGPSMTLNTMCSSSLASVHLACKSIENGECEMAIAGGVNLSLHPNKYNYLSRDNFLATDGRCRSFGENGDGYVPGEGVGAVLLKPLSKAIEDKDYIYGTIIGGRLNHGGKTSGYSVPSPMGQADLIASAMSQSGIDPKTIGYIETHGTGTSLGDPIEISSLSRAFKGAAPDRKSCSIGSVKSNIGHLESAAGIAAISKLVMQLKYKKRVPSIHSTTLNSNIDFEHSPFYVQQTLEDWDTVSINKDKVSRRAGVSSFGAGGANCHLILEEHQADTVPDIKTEDKDQLIIFSAAGPEQLKEYVKDIHQHLIYEAQQGLAVDIKDMAYTLQVGREMYGERLAVLAKDTTELAEQLSLVLKGVGSEKVLEPQKGHTTDKTGINNLSRYTGQEDYQTIGQLWVNGHDVDWNKFNHGRTVQKTPLPGVPYIKNSYWLPLDILSEEASCNKTSGRFYRLIDGVDTSNSLESGVTFQKEFSQQDRELLDHNIAGNCILPGVCYLEMVLEAVDHIYQDKKPEICDMVWLAPFKVDHGKKSLKVTFNKQDETTLKFRLWSDQETQLIHARGQVSLSEKETGDSPQCIDPDSLYQRLSHEMDHDAIYDRYKAVGITYGLFFKGIKQTKFNDSEGFSRISLTPEISKLSDQYMIHPAILDAALQSVVGPYSLSTDHKKALLPFSFKKLTWLNTIPNDCFAYIKQVGEGRYNLAVLDPEGAVCLKMEEIQLRENKKHYPDFCYQPVWNPGLMEKGTIGARTPERVLIIGTKDSHRLAESLTDYFGGSQVIQAEIGADNATLRGNEFRIKAGDEHAFTDLFSQVKGVDQIYFLGIMNNGPDSFENPDRFKQNLEDTMVSFWALSKAFFNAKDVLDGVVVKVVTNNGVPFDQERDLNPLGAGIIGVSKSLKAENSFLNISCLDIDTDEMKNPSQLPLIVEQLAEQSATEDDADIALRNGKRFQRELKPVALKESDEDPFKTGGVYFILGGTGGLGFQLALHLARKYQAKLALIGRRDMDGTIEKQLSEIRENGGQAIYLTADAERYDQMKSVADTTVETFGQINGVVHSALILKDGLIKNMTRDAFIRSLTPKVHGSVNLYKVFKNSSLDFMVFFSSAVSFMQSPGQSNYSAGCAFKDLLAHQLGKISDFPVKVINWGYWGSVGVVSDDRYAKRMDSIGLLSIEIKEGMDIIDGILKNDLNQIVPYKAKQSLLEELGLKKPVVSHKGVVKTKPAEGSVIEKTSLNTPSRDRSSLDDRQLNEKVKAYLKKIFARVLKLNPDQLEDGKTFENYGVDSLVTVDIINELEHDFKDLPATLLFEFMTINKLGEHFIKRYKDQLIQLLSPATLTRKTSTDDLFQNTGERLSVDDITFPVSPLHTESPKQNTAGTHSSDIAIIGLSGRYPMADNPDQFWDNLIHSRNCITSIPEDRWPLEPFFDPDNRSSRQSYTKWGGFIRGIKKFDPLFFNISPLEAEQMDPQSRLFLETSWEVIEDAGYSIKELIRKSGKVGVFVGVMNNGYSQVRGNAWLKGKSAGAGAAYWSIANRVSYCFDFYGPSLAVDTACSSSATAIHLACESLKRGESAVAIAGGVNLISHPSQFSELSEMKMLSKSDKLRAFGEGGDGFVDGEGVGAVLLKPLEEAKKDNDRIYGVIKSTSVNAGGKTSGFTVPNPNAQSDVITDAIEKANISPETISYIEAHGTGTSLGDPIEIVGLNNSFQSFTDKKQFCAIGSVKSNIGHLESAACIAGLTKVLLQFRHHKKVPSLHADTINPRIRFADTPFYLQNTLEEWETEQSGTPKRAGISSFGAGGANAHMIVEEYPYQAVKDDHQVKENRIFTLSARTKEQLSKYAEKYLDFLTREMGEIQSAERSPLTLEEVRQKIIRTISQLLDIEADQIDINDTFTELGFDPVQYHSLISKLQKIFNLPVQAEFKPETCLSVSVLSRSIWEKKKSLHPNGNHNDPDGMERPAKAGINFYDLITNLQLGRESMEHRLAIVTDDIESLIKGLRDFLKGENPDGNIFNGIADGSKTDLLLDGREGEEYLKIIVSDYRYNKLARLWTNGADIDWKILHSAHKYNKISLPTYPFAEKNLWLDIFDENFDTDTLKQAEAYTSPTSLSLDKETDEPAVFTTITDIVIRLLKLDIDDITGHESFHELGMDSIQANKITDEINKAFDINLAPTALFNYSSVSKLSEHLEKNEYLSLEALRKKHGTKMPEAGCLEDRSTPSIGTIETPKREITDIAIIGVSGRFPEADDVDEFWENLKKGKNCIREFPKNRCDIDEYYDPQPQKPGKTCSKWLGAINDIDKFDPQFFGLLPMEARAIDPQQRLFLEESWKAIEDSGYSIDALSDKKCGVFAGNMSGDYVKLMDQAGGNTDAFSMLGTHAAVLPARISFFLNLKGPAISVDTACSSSLVAIHQACQSIISGESQMALAGGVFLTTTPYVHVLSSSANMLSPDGKCKTFDNSANGIAIGEGVGVVVLKDLRQAREDGDQIYAVIKGSGMNQDGKTNGITAPNAISQKDLEIEVYQKSNIHPETISYVEAHGTGTKLGDPVEIEGLTGSFRSFTRQTQFCGIGSVKTNIGHSFAAAGIISFIKTVMSLKNKQMLPSIHMKQKNEHINFEDSPFYVNTELKDWKKVNGTPRRAAVSAFGYTGTNAHVVLEEYPETESGHLSDAEELVVISAKTKKQLTEYVRKWVSFLDNQAKHRHLSQNLGNIAYTSQIGRSGFNYRLAVITDSADDLVHKLNSYLAGRLVPDAVFEGKASFKNKEHISVRPGENINLGAIAEGWVVGKAVEWKSVFNPNNIKKRVSIPTYPLARIRCWVEGKKPVETDCVSTGQTEHSGLKKLESDNDSEVITAEYARQLADGLKQFQKQLNI